MVCGSCAYATIFSCGFCFSNKWFIFHLKKKHNMTGGYFYCWNFSTFDLLLAHTDPCLHPTRYHFFGVSLVGYDFTSLFSWLCYIKSWNWFYYLNMVWQCVHCVPTASSFSKYIIRIWCWCLPLFLCFSLDSDQVYCSELSDYLFDLFPVILAIFGFRMYLYYRIPFVLTRLLYM